jgi:hypothetical protein
MSKVKSKRSRPQRSRTGKVHVSGIVSAKAVKLAPIARRGSSYREILEQMAKFTKPEQATFVDVPAGTAVKVFHNRLNSAFRRTPPVLKKGLDYVKRTEEGAKRVVIMSVKANGRVRK